MSQLSRVASTALLISLTGCASTPGAKPHDMSTAGHEEHAKAEDATARGHTAQYDPTAMAPSDDGCRRRVGTHSGETFGTCWTSWANPTEEHLQMAEKHRKMAADHRAASQALRDAEASACVGLSPDDRDMSPFLHREDVASVAPLNTQQVGKTAPRLVGATIVFRAVPGLTEERLQRIVACHLARNASVGHNAPEMPYCPLVPKGAAAAVSSVGGGFAVAVRSEDSGGAQEILRRSLLLAPK